MLSGSGAPPRPAGRRAAVGPRTVFLVAALLALLTAGLATAPGAAAEPPPSDGPRAELRGMVEDVTGATARYAATDSAGHGMDAAKIIEDGDGGYLAVYHTMRDDGRFHASVATSSDLLNWTFAADLGTGASQPTLTRVSDGGFLVAWEQDPGNHVALRYYTGRDTLLSASPAREFDAPQTLSTCPEGTPSIYSVQLSPDIDHSVIDLGGHYYRDCDVDRQMRATLTDFSSWSATPQPEVDNAMLYWGVQGNIGDRDAVTFRGYTYGLFEGQYTKGDFGSWRTFVYDYATGNADTTAIRTAGGSLAFANPTVTALKAPDGRDAILVTLFVPSQNSAPGESGELIYYHTYS
ncbi:hypothetical protein [Streptomyces sp. NPDC050560]|uniref:hypothetical protein n=1 Tax=Streptomyces sp. NPDC050560 TaxID=3365630 RepID=UPI0037AB1083